MQEGNKRIIFNGLANHYHSSGFGVYSRNLLKEFDRLGVVKAGFFFSNSGVNSEIAVQKVAKFLRFNNGTLGHILRILWYQFILPLRLFRSGEVYYSPLPEGSVWGRFNQVITIHDIIPLLYPESHKNLSIYYKYLLPLIIRKSKYVVVPSKSTRDDVINYYNLDSSKVVVAYNGFDRNVFFLEEESKIKNYLIFIGDLRPHKNFDTFIEAFSRTSDLDLLIVGEQNEETLSFYNKLFKERNIEGRIKFSGRVNDSELRKIYSCAKALVYPSLYEGFGLPIVEALACGCPVLTSDRASMAEVASSLTVKVDPFAVEDIREKIEYLKNNKHLKKNSEIDNVLKKYDWKITAEKVSEVLLN